MIGCKERVHYDIDDENCYEITDYYDESGYRGTKTKVIIRKEPFIMCYNKWIKGEKE